MPRSRARAVAIALRRQRDPAPLPPWLFLLAALAAGVAAAHAQAPAPLLPPGAGGERQAAPIGAPPVENPDIPGATKTRANPDPGIEVAPPGVGG
ncbi:MAG: hypothetical protein JO157_05650, partial [Acetobacteraceae bacterium]|nr:hypothetical protein [Acetobacteraceae bacterium]